VSARYHCEDQRRRAAVLAARGTDGTPVVNGIDYLEVAPSQRTLLVHFLHDLAGPDAVTGAVQLGEEHIRIDGGVRVTGIAVQQVTAAGKLLSVEVDPPGDFSTYTLCLVASPPDGNPPAGFDLRLSAVAFSFKVDCPSEFDCQADEDCPEPALPSPQIDYLAKDYASFRRLLFDRMAVTMPGWTERNPADVGVALVELLAYAGDQLSYYQDAVATEAYLGTARRRTSIRRHARLVDYVLHDGVNARTWVCFEVDQVLRGGRLLPAGTALLTRSPDGAVSVPPAVLDRALAAAPIVFETLHDIGLLKPNRNAIQFYTWGDADCCLPKGATCATLRGSAAELELGQGDVLVFEEVLGPTSGLAVDADPAHRHAVRLDRPPVERVDPLNSTKVLDICWHADDALPFPLCLTEISGQAGGTVGASVARGNVALADHGLTLAGLDDGGLRPAEVSDRGRYRPVLSRPGLTHRMPYDHQLARTQAAAAALAADLRAAVPAVVLRGEGEDWHPQRDLLASDRFAAEFVVEMEEDGQAHLRFGDGVRGRRPATGTRFNASYRIGNGTAGNLGAEALGRVVTAEAGITRVRNPLPAVGGTEPEPLQRVLLDAPQAFRVQERAVTEADYASTAQRHPQVQRAAATRRWTGSWHTMFVTVDRKGSVSVDEQFRAELRAFLEGFRLAGYDLEIDAPRFVPLDLALDVCVTPASLRSEVKQALLEAFGNRDLPDGQRGFFHPDSFTFKQPVYLSQVVAAAMGVPGVQWVSPTRFQRWGQEPAGELSAGRITFERLEIARLDNDANTPENGRLDLVMRGGL
jgi:Baseplate J-like protein